MSELLQVKHLKKYFPVKKGLLKTTVGHIKAVDDVSFSVDEAETFGLVGESGCGKTTVGKCVINLHTPTAGEVILGGENILKLSKSEMREKRKDIQMVFQDPYGSLNPRMSVETIIGEPIVEHKIAAGKEVTERVKDLMQAVGLNAKEIKKYPHEFSGGQRQRIAIARAIAVDPKLIVCDEPVSALDVSIQAQILNLLKDLQEKRGISYLFIAHGMPAVSFMSRRVGVMYLGQLVEVADAKSFFERQYHPYSVALMSAVPDPDPENKGERIMLGGEVPNLMNPPSGCRFHPRCSFACEKCRNEMPELKDIGNGRQVACHLAEKFL